MSASTFPEDPAAHTAPHRYMVNAADYDLAVRQHPERARVAGAKEKERKPVDPPPIIQLRVRDEADPVHNYLQSPYYFMCCTLYHATEDRPAPVVSANALTGTLVSSLHRLKDIDNQDGGFFVFGDLSIRMEGEFRLMFDLYEMRKEDAIYLKSAVSKPFSVLPPKNFPGMSESTFLSRSFADQGVKLRIRKEPRTLLKRPLPRAEDYPAPIPPRSPDRPSIGHPPVANNYQASRDYYSQYYGGSHDVKRQRTSVDNNVSPRPIGYNRPVEAYHPSNTYQPQQGAQYDASLLHGFPTPTPRSGAHNYV
ncbi:hypothetical protein FQN57_002472 [Myotisia sp. PD_48]|nr:hypothetical protein FQN57_002472 [Myotisia sp. PD_48]